MNWPLPVRLLVTLWAFGVLVVSTGLSVGVVALCCLLRVPEAHMQWIPRFWAWSVLHLGIFCPVRVLGRENLDPEGVYVFAANHTSALDILALQVVLPPNFRWLAKKELFDIPFFGWAMARCGYIPIDRSDARAALRSLQQAGRRIAAGASVLVFPEGTRSVSRELLPFKSGGLALAIRARRPVVPVAILGARRALPPKKYLLNPGVIHIVFGRPIPVEGLKLGQREELARRVQQEVQALLDAARARLEGRA